MKLQLVAKIVDPELLGKSMHEEGTLFYLQDGKGSITRAVYFSSSRVIDYEGNVDDKLAQRIRHEGHRAQLIEVDELKDSVRIIQGSSE